MAENITRRISRIISGSLHAMVDAMEGVAPEAVLEQAIREIDIALDEVRAELGKVIAAKHLANKNLNQKLQKNERLNNQLELAVKEQRDDLAQAAISQQLDIEAQIPVLEKTIANYGEQEAELENYVKALQAKIREMRDEMDSLSKQPMVNKDEATAVTNGNSKQSISTKIDKASSAFDRLIEKQHGSSAGNGSFDSKQEAKLAELEQLSRQHRINERLAAIKSKLQ